MKQNIGFNDDRRDMRLYWDMPSTSCRETMQLQPKSIITLSRFRLANPIEGFLTLLHQLNKLHGTLIFLLVPCQSIEELRCLVYKRIALLCSKVGQVNINVLTSDCY